MGMFTSIFGSSGSDKADKARQEAMDAFNSIKTPELSALQVKLNDYVNAGKITPEQAEATLLNSNAFNAIHTDPSLIGAQKQALQKLQEVGGEGGLTAIDKAQLQDITDQQTQENRSASEATMENARARGMGNSDMSTVNQLIQQQGSADRASRAGLDVAAQAQARALQALQAAGTLGGQMEGQQFGEQAQKATAANAIDQFNAANSTDMSKFNTANSLAAQQANLANAQNVNNLNTETQNTNKVYNAEKNQTVFNDELQKATGKSGTLNQWANDATNQKARETGADLALTGGLLNGAAGAASYGMAGPAAGATSGVMQGAPTGYNPKIAPNQYASMGYAEGGVVEEPKRSIADEFEEFTQKYCHGGTINMADGGKVHIKPSNMKAGGKVGGTPKVHGDSPKNDTVPAMLSPGEVVLPRTVVNSPEKVGHFMKATTGYDPIAAALRRLSAPKL